MTGDWRPLSELHAAIADAESVSDGPARYQPGCGYGRLRPAPPCDKTAAAGEPEHAREQLMMAALAFLSEHPEFCRHAGDCPGHPATEVLEHMAALGQGYGEITPGCWGGGEPVITQETIPAPEPVLSGELFGEAAGIWAALSARTWLDESELPQYGTIYPGHCSGCLLPGTWKAGRCWYCCKEADLAARDPGPADGFRWASWLTAATVTIFAAAVLIMLIATYGGH